MKLGYRPNEAAQVLGSTELLKECKQAGWIKPKIERRRLVLYDFNELAKCWSRICAGEVPNPLRRAPRKEAANASA